MKKDKEKREIGKFTIVFLLIISLLAVCSSCFAIYELLLLNSIENLIRYIVIGIFILFDIFIICRVRKIVRKKYKKKPKIKLLISLLFIYFIICFSLGIVIFYVYGQLKNLNKNVITYTSDLLVMKNSNANDINDVHDMSIGILTDKNNVEGYIIPQEIIKSNKLNDENKIVEYDDYTTMLVDMYSNELDAMFVSSNYVTMFSGITGYENIQDDTKVIISKSKKMRKADTSVIETASSGKSITEPFSILLMGIDSTDEVLTKNAIANGDTLILITFNPKTLNATMISIPRDSYLPIACWSGNPENKITHAAAYGNDCIIQTIQNYFNVKIDYYAKINFKGLVKLVDAMGGVDVNVEKRLCTDDSSRMNEICIDPGYQTLNGEQALVFARNRKALANGDFGRAKHQQEIVMALVNKMKTINNVSTFMDILNTISNSMDTNLTTKQILSFYNIAKDIIKRSLSSDSADLVNIQQLYLQGSGQMIYDERAKMVLWDYIPNKDSRKDVIQAMKENLELVGHEDITEFSFSINDPYEKEIIGEGPYKNTFVYSLLPDFTGDTEAQARATASSLGLSVSFVGTSGTVVSQNFPARKRIDLIKQKLVLTLSNNDPSDREDKKDAKSKEKEKDKSKEKDDDKDSITNDDSNTDKKTDDDNDNTKDKDNDKDKDNNNSNDNNQNDDNDDSNNE